MKPDDCPVCKYIYRAIANMMQQGVEFDIERMTDPEDGIHCTNGHKILGQVVMQLSSLLGENGDNTAKKLDVAAATG